MHEHIIRLRGGWERHGASGPGSGDEGRRVALPLVWADDGASRLRLVRFFQTPPIDSRSETIDLRLDDVPGLVAVELNGRLLARPAAGTESLRLALAEGLPSGSRNRLVLEVERVEPAPGAGSGRPWGQVALVIRRIGPDDGPAGRTPLGT
jgi:hypothetical protein